MKESDIQNRACYKCKRVFQLSRFPSGARKDGTHSYCIECYNAYKRIYYSKHRDKEIARSSQYNKLHPERCALNLRKCRERNLEHFKKNKLAWELKNKDRVKLYAKNKEAKRRLAKRWSAGISAEQWKLIRENFNFCCAYCHIKPDILTMDHVIPLSKGGTHDPINIIPACKMCNSRKTHLDVKEFQSRNRMSANRERA